MYKKENNTFFYSDFFFQVLTSVKQQRLKDVVGLFRQTENEIRGGGLCIDDDGAQAFINDYKTVAFLSGNNTLKKQVDQFVVVSISFHIKLCSFTWKLL